MMAYLWFFILWSAQAQMVESTHANNKAARALEENNSRAAQQELLKALQDPKVSGAARLNMGLSFEVNKQVEEALKEYELVIQSPHASPQEKFAAHYNAGRLLQLQKMTDLALAHYQSALSIQPDSYEVKHNIEMLTQQGGGGGQGDDPQKEPQDGDKNDPNQQPSDTDPEQQKKEAQTKPKEMSEKDVQKILEELKNQEQEIRAKELGGQPPKKDQNGKDW